MSKRTSQVKLSVEAKVLRKLRERAGLSMREAGEKIGISNSMISQIENGRENFPKKDKLVRFLDLYDVSQYKFVKMVNEFKEEETDSEVLMSLIPKLKSGDVKTLRTMAEHFLS